MPSGNTEHEAVLKIYPAAYYDFDYEGLDEVYEGHTLRYDPPAAQDSIVQVKRFLEQYLK